MAIAGVTPTIKKRISKYILEPWGHIFGVWLYAFTCLGIVSARCMEDNGVLLGSLESFPLDGVNMQQLGPLHILDLTQGGHQLYYVMAVAGSEIADVHTIEDVLLVGQQGLQRVVEPDNLLTAALVQDAPFEEMLRCPEPQIVIELAGVHLVQILLHAAHTMVNAHIIVIQDNQQVIIRTGNIVQSLVGQSSAHTSVSDHGHHLSVCLALLLSGNSHSQCGRYAVRGMSAGKGVVLALLWGREGAQTMQLPVCVELLLTACKNLMAGSLMSYVPHNSVIGCIEYIMQGNGQLYYA